MWVHYFNIKLTLSSVICSRNLPAGFQVLSGVLMKRYAFWETITCNPLKVSRRLEINLNLIFDIDKEAKDPIKTR
jgi:hypothetical protein